MHLTFGQRISGLTVDGVELQAAVFDENQVRAAAGITMALGALAFAFAGLGKEYAPLQIITTFFFVEFVIRVTLGLRYSPVGVLAKWMTRGHTPDWASAKPKRFAWTLGVVMSFSMMVITNSGIRGLLPATICSICLTLMWMESVLGICLGCRIHGLLVRRGWATKDPAFEVCSQGACAIPDARAAGRAEIPA